MKTDSCKCSHLSLDGPGTQGYTRVCYATTLLKSILSLLQMRAAALLFPLQPGKGFRNAVTIIHTGSSTV